MSRLAEYDLSLLHSTFEASPANCKPQSLHHPKAPKSKTELEASPTRKFIINIDPNRTDHNGFTGTPFRLCK
jgi:hypothetical protein